MKIEFTIPDPQPIQVVIERNWFTGSFTCTANGQSQEMRSPLDIRTHFNIATTNNYTMQIGEHTVEVGHTRPRFFGGLRPQTYIVKVDGRLVAEQTGF